MSGYDVARRCWIRYRIADHRFHEVSAPAERDVSHDLHEYTSPQETQVFCRVCGVAGEWARFAKCEPRPQWEAQWREETGG